MNPGTLRLSSRSLLVGLGGLAAVSVIRTLILIGAGGANGPVFVSDIGSAVVVLFAAATMFKAALSFAPGERIRLQWLLAATGVLCFALGDVAWAWIELGTGGEVPYPGLPDIFYVAEYLFLGAALVMAAFAYRGLVDIRPAAGIATTAGVVLLGLLYAGLLQPYVIDAPGVSAGAETLSTLYPVLDVALLFTPSMMLVLVVSKLGSGRLAWPWWAMGVGALMLAASDAGYSWLSAARSYEGGAIVDYGWMLAHVAFAFGASLALDVLRPVPGRLRPSA